MISKKLLFIISLFGVFILVFMLNFFGDEEVSGRVEKIEYGNNKISIFLENSDKEFIVFSSEILDFGDGDLIVIRFTKGDALDNQRVVNKITLK